MKKTAIITGSTGLIGSEMVKEFLNQGYKVYGLDLNRPQDFDHPDFEFIKCDLSHEKQVKAAFKKIKSLDVLINNAAIADPECPPVEKMTLATWNKSLGVNLTSYFLMTRSALPLLKKRSGSIINISSTRHRMSEPHTELYTTAKGGIDALTRALAISYAHEVRVNSISPGWIADPKTKMKPIDHKQHPSGRVGMPSDIASFALYLASEKAGFITGQDFIIDGGMSVKMIYA